MDAEALQQEQAERERLAREANEAIEAARKALEQAGGGE